MTPAAVSTCLCRARPHRGAILPYRPGGIEMLKPRPIAFRLWGSIDVFKTLRRSYPMESGVERVGIYLRAFVLNVDDICTVDACWWT